MAREREKDIETSQRLILVPAFVDPLTQNVHPVRHPRKSDPAPGLNHYTSTSLVIFPATVPETTLAVNFRPYDVRSVPILLDDL